jgi:hypothetical protein
VKADFMVLLDSLDLKKNKKILWPLFPMQIGGETQDGRQSMKCSRCVKTVLKFQKIS